MPALICRSLTHDYRLTSASADLLDEFRFIETVPELPQLQLLPAEIGLSSAFGFCVAGFPDGTRLEGSPFTIVSAMHALTFADATRFDPGAPILHGATVLIGERRLLLVGHKRVGKTTLTLHLLGAGHRVEGDEHLVVGAGSVIARPRTLRIKPGTLALAPALAAAVARAPFITGWDGMPIAALSPAAGGVDWVIRQGRLDAIVFLTANHGGRSVAGAISHEQAFRRLALDVAFWPEDVARASARLWQLLMVARPYELLLGDVDGAEWHLRQIARPLRQ